MNKRFWAIIVIIIVIFAGLLWASGRKQNNTNSNATVQPTEHLRGDTASKVKFVEYGDFECPYCGEYYPIVEQVFQKYQNQVSFQFRNLPLSQIHPNAFAGARAAEAASDQGKFWQMYALLYQNQSSWVNSTDVESIFEQYAAQLGLNATKFKTDFASSEVNNRINADISAFNKTGLEMATPTFLLNGKQIQATSVNSFDQLINAQLNKEGA